MTSSSSSTFFSDPNLSTIHVPSGPTTTAQPPTTTPLSTLSLPALITRRENLEAELKALGAVLDSHGVTMHSSLTTFDGYPRADIDVAQVRVTRARIICLRNDWKEVMGWVERGLHAHYADLQQQEQAGARKEDGTSVARDVRQPNNGETETETATSPTHPHSQSPPPALEAPFARINTVEPSSPAHEAGLKAGDLIRRFGTAIWSNHERLRKVGEVVQQNQGRPILVRVQRGTGTEMQELEVRVTPRVGWGGRGSLGCHILPI